MRLAYKETDGKTKKAIEERRKQEMHESNVRLFGRQTIGVHGCELPKFSNQQESREWWKKKFEYVQNPNYQSAKQLKQDRKFWAKNDLMYLSDTNFEPGPEDDFKQTFVKKDRKNSV